MSKWLLIFSILIKFILPPFLPFSKVVENTCRKELVKRPEHHWALWFLASLYVWQGKYMEARVFLEDLISMGSKNTEVFRSLVNVYFKLQYFDKINELTNKFSNIKLKKKDVTNYYVGSSLVVLGVDHKRAIEYLNSYIQSNPSSSEAYEMLGLAHYDKKEFDTALVFFKQAEKLNPGKKQINEKINSCLKKITKSNGRDTIESLYH